MNKTINEQYLDGLIDNTIDIDPTAMSLVLQWMESIRQSSGVNNGIEQTSQTINENYMDNMIETAIGADPVAMYQLLNKLDSLTEHPERDRAFSAYIDELAGGIDDQLKEYLGDLSFAGSEIMTPSILNPRSDMDINYNTIKVLNDLEARLERIERNLELLCKEEKVKFKAVI